jgi:hypothetical protein
LITSTPGQIPRSHATSSRLSVGSKVRLTI